VFLKTTGLSLETVIRVEIGGKNLIKIQLIRHEFIIIPIYEAIYKDFVHEWFHCGITVKLKIKSYKNGLCFNWIKKWILNKHSFNSSKMHITPPLKNTV
jgi:hypothetical protein